MLRPKSNATWNGTKYEYEQKYRNSCKICIFCSADNFCTKLGADINIIKASYYKYCKYYSPKKMLKKVKHESKVGKKADAIRPNEFRSDDRFHEKTVISPRKKKIKVVSIYSKAILRRVLDNASLLVQFRDKPNYKEPSSLSTIEIGMESPLGKDLLGAKVGKIHYS